MHEILDERQSDLTPVAEHLYGCERCRTLLEDLSQAGSTARWVPCVPVEEEPAEAEAVGAVAAVKRLASRRIRWTASWTPIAAAVFALGAGACLARWVWPREVLITPPSSHPPIVEVGVSLPGISPVPPEPQPLAALGKAAAVAPYVAAPTPAEMPESTTVAAHESMPGDLSEPTPSAADARDDEPS